MYQDCCLRNCDLNLNLKEVEVHFRQKFPSTRCQLLELILKVLPHKKFEFAMVQVVVVVELIHCFDSFFFFSFSPVRKLTLEIYLFLKKLIFYFPKKSNFYKINFLKKL